MAEGFHLLSSGGWQHPRRSELSTPLQLEAFCHWAGGAEGILEGSVRAGGVILWAFEVAIGPAG